jgi:hypothetical protein
METGDRVVQRELNDSRTVVAERVEKIVAFRHLFPILIATIVFVALIPFGYTSAQSTTTTGQTTTNAQFPGCPTGTVKMQSANNPHEQPMIQCYDSSGSLTTLTPQNSTAALTVNAANVASAAENQCSLLAFNFSNCIWNPFLTFLASLLMSLAAMALTVAGSLFDLLIVHTVIDFKGTLTGLQMLSSNGVVGPIDRMWATFRDVANILIIGMFVFVAISTILSIENYGAKKWIAKILIVAILINFSMFFTKFTIDASNFVARQLYTSIPILTQSAQNTSGTVGTATNTTANGSSGVQVGASGITGTFESAIGISGVWNYPALSTLTTAQGPLAMLSYSLGATLFMFILALLLFYGSFLLASRAILLIFLLLTSSLAFAAMLLPGKFGDAMWSRWRTSLINAAVFAPLLMLFLTATLLILTGATSVAGQGTLASFLNDPASTTGWGVLFIFIIASGLLFLSIKVSNSFASKIAGFDYASAIPTLGLAAGTTAASFGLRSTVGRGAARFSESQAQQATKLNTSGNHVRAGFASLLSGTAGQVGKASFNPLSTKTGASLLAPAGGVKGPIGGMLKKAVGTGKGGSVEDEKRSIKAQQERAAKYTPSKELQEKVRKEAQANATPEQKAELDSRNQQVAVEEARKTALSNDHKKQLAAANNKVKTAAEGATANPADTAAQKNLSDAVGEQRIIEAQQKQAMAAAENNIKLAKEAADAKEREFVPKEALQTKGEIVADIAHRRPSNLLWRMITRQTAANDKFAQKVRNASKKKEDTEKEKARLTALVGDIPPAAPAPAAAPTEH